MKILVLNGSPKRDNSDTMHITRAFLDGMKEAAPQDIHIIHTVDQHIVGIIVDDLLPDLFGILIGFTLRGIHLLLHILH